MNGQGVGFRFRGAGLWVFGFRVWGLGFSVLDLGGGYDDKTPWMVMDLLKKSHVLVGLFYKRQQTQDERQK